ncbi:MAG: tRNA (adenosine(37)-N6)-threonylcarbamoyltransferase complex transferase subunit TsaD [Phycisphaerales bacterium]|nr:tRNA (adenosine(37)-N6)-threonylcarbamoyltransferase complex transferase subunit TsaD [Phycisphaerales bacterium]
MLILGLETSCDETAAAVVRDGREVLSSAVATQNELHAEYSGVVPEIASRAHVERILPVIRSAVELAGVKLAEVDAVAVGHRPGLIGSLLIGVSAAKALAWSLARPLVAVDHVHAHLYAGVLGRAEQPGFPALGLVVSGGHTSLYSVRGWTGLERLGATIDDALGEAYDKAATILGIPYPGGPGLDRLAQAQGANDRAYDLPISRLGPGSLDFSFSGLKTAVLYAVRGVPDGPDGYARDHSALTAQAKADVAASFQRTVCRTVILKLERAMDRLAGEGRPVASLLTGGGVTANSRLRTELGAFARARGLQLFLPPMGYCVDNAAMIAGLAHHLAREGRFADLTLEPMPTTAC